MTNGLWVSPGALDFGQLVQGNSETLQVVVGNTSNDTSLNWNVDSGGTSWLTLDMSSGTLQPGNQQAINVTAETTSLAAGNYTATLNFTSNGENIQVSVALVVHAAAPPVPPPPQIAVSPGLLNFGTMKVHFVQTLQVMVMNNSDTMPLTWSADTSGANWVTLDISSGALQPGDQQTVNVTVDTSSLAANILVGSSNYETALTFAVNGGQNLEAESVYVQVNVIPEQQRAIHVGGPKAPVASPTSINFGTLRGKSATLQVVISNISSDTPLPWVADTGGATWVTLAPVTSGTLAHRLSVLSNQTINVTASASSLPPGKKNSATLTFTSTDPSLTPPTSVQVSVTMNT